LWDVSGGNRVIKIPNSNVVVKFGRGVTQAEAQTQTEVSRLIDPKFIHVPQVHHFYHNGDQKIGYIVMEFVEGEPIDANRTEHVEALQKALDHLSSLKTNFPGPLHSSERQGILWKMTHLTITTRVKASKIGSTSGKMTKSFWMAKILSYVISTQLYRICLGCLTAKICLLDWASAGSTPDILNLQPMRRKGNQTRLWKAF
jgi:hypothetical protein